MLRKIAHTASTAATHLDISEDDIFAYLSQCVFGSEVLLEVFERESVAWLPFFILANLLATFRPKDCTGGSTWTGSGTRTTRLT